MKMSHIAPKEKVSEQMTGSLTEVARMVEDIEESWNVSLIQMFVGS